MDQIRDPLGKCDTHKSMSPDRMHSQVLRELADTAKLLSIICKGSWRRGEILLLGEDWSLQGKKYRACSFQNRGETRLGRKQMNGRGT